MIKELHITVGLPASGKSTWAENKMKEWKLENLPRILRCADRVDISRTIAGVSNSLNRDYYVILDGLFLTNDDILGVLEIFNKYEAEIKSVIINYWKEDRENCLINDEGRRKVGSKSTIKNAKLDIMDLNYLKENSPYKNISIVERDVYKMNNFDKFIKKLGFSSTEDKIKLEWWGLGGSYGNCWDSTMQSVSADEQPEPNRFDKIVTEVFGENISLKKYKEVKRECLSIETEYDGDYYGGGTEEAYYVLDLRNLYEMVEE